MRLTPYFKEFRMSTVLIVVISITVCLLLMYLLLIQSSFSLFWIEILGVSNKIGPNNTPVEVSDTLFSDTEVIYVFFELDSNIPIRLKTRWYFENQLIFEDETIFQPGINHSWLASRKGSFDEGQYRVEIGGQIVYFLIEGSIDNNTAELNSCCGVDLLC